MKEYPKINSVYKRDMANKGAFIEGEWATPEIEFLQQNQWLWTEKVDGTNIRVQITQYANGDLDIIYGGRTDNAQIPVKLLYELDDIFKSQEFTALFNSTFIPTENMLQVTIYGEGYGAGIQSGGDYSPKPSFVVFDVVVDNWWLSYANVMDVATKLGLDFVPLIMEGTIVDAIVAVKVGFTSWWPGVKIPEGLVGRPAVEMFSRKGERILCKVKHKDLVR